MALSHSSAEDPRLIESEQRYRAVIQNASDMIQSVRPDGTFEFVNQAWLNKLGYTPDEVPALTIWDIIHPDAVDHCQQLFTLAVQGETIDYMETTFMAKDGQPIPVDGNVTSRFVGDTVVATHGFFRDISERLRAQELEARNEQLEREQRARYLEKMAALGKLSAGLAHELNNPAAATQRASARLAESIARWDAALHELIRQELQPGQWQTIDALQGDNHEPGASTLAPDPLAINDMETTIEEWLEAHDFDQAWEIAPSLVQTGLTEDRLDLLAQQLPASALTAAVQWHAETQTVRELTEIIARSSHRISELVNAVKGYSYMDRATEQHVNLHDGLENTLIILGHRLRDITVKRLYDSTLPDVRVFGSSLNQVWTNILDNAIDATAGTGTITIRTGHDHDNEVVEIEDDGVGISRDDLTCIFEPFFTTKPQGQGTGLGLDTVWRIVTEEHGGTITVDSEPGRTVFRVSLPLSWSGPQPAHEHGEDDRRSIP
jgi:PAS domain S-box-containing protein